MIKQKLFRNEEGDIKEMLSTHQGYTFNENPFDFYIILARYKFVAKMLTDKKKVIDIGCGHGFGSVLLSKSVAELKAVDIDKELVEYCKKTHTNPNISFEEFDLLNYSQEMYGQFDGLCSLDVIEHFDYTQIPGVVEQYAKLLKKDGVAVIGTPNKNSHEYASIRRKESHPFEFEYDDFKAKLQEQFSNVFVFSMTDETVSTSFPKMAWYFMALCIK